MANKKLVSAKKRDDDDALAANHDEADESEVFNLVENGDGTVSFQSMGYGLFVTVDLNHGAALIPSSDSAEVRARSVGLVRASIRHACHLPPQRLPPARPIPGPRIGERPDNALR